MALPQRLIKPLAKPVKWSVAVPGSKSYMNRAVLCAALAQGQSILSNPVYCDDTNYLITALEALGVRFKKSARQLVIYGTGGKFCQPKRAIAVGNAGTTLRFLLPHLPPGTTITGNTRMQQRPIGDLVTALQELGFVLECVTGCPPVTVHERVIRQRTVHLRATVSSQFVSSLLLLAPTLPNGLKIIIPGKLVSAPYVAMTVAVMQSFGIKVQQPRKNVFEIRPQSYQAQQYTIEGDASAATYWWALAAISRSKITVTNVPVQTLQPDIQFLDYLRRMGCTVVDTTVVGPFAGPQMLHGIKVNMQTCPDAVMSLAIVAALAKGVTIITGVKHLAVKETNRLQALRFNLRKLGVSVRVTATTLRIQGRNQALWSGKLSSYDDHRLAMAFAILGLVQPGLSITQPDCVRKSYPTFWRDLRIVQRQAHNQTIVLTGMRGSGKTTLGRQWAKQWQSHIVDLDKGIEQQFHQSLRLYIEQHGWRNFRKVEHTLFQKFLVQPNRVIATGGGTLIYPRNVRLLNNQYVILLTAPLPVLRQRLRADITRPALLRGSHSAATEIAAVWKKRQAKYFAVADNIYDSR